MLFFLEKDSDNCRDFTVLKKIALYPSAFNSVGAEMLFPLFICFQALVARVIPVCAVSPSCCRVCGTAKVERH